MCVPTKLYCSLSPTHTDKGSLYVCMPAQVSTVCVASSPAVAALQCIEGGGRGERKREQQGKKPAITKIEKALKQRIANGARGIKTETRINHYHKCTYLFSLYAVMQ